MWANKYNEYKSKYKMIKSNTTLANKILRANAINQRVTERILFRTDNQLPLEMASQLKHYSKDLDLNLDLYLDSCNRRLRRSRDIVDACNELLSIFGLDIAIDDEALCRQFASKIQQKVPTDIKQGAGNIGKVVIVLLGLFIASILYLLSLPKETKKLKEETRAYFESYNTVKKLSLLTKPNSGKIERFSNSCFFISLRDGLRVINPKFSQSIAQIREDCGFINRDDSFLDLSSEEGMKHSKKIREYLELNGVVVAIVRDADDSFIISLMTGTTRSIVGRPIIPIYNYMNNGIGNHFEFILSFPIKECIYPSLNLNQLNYWDLPNYN